MSVHLGIVGPTMSGKTTLIRSLIKEARRQGFATGVCDPNGEPGWGAQFVTDCPDKMLAWAKKAGRVFMVLEEAGDYLNNTAAARAYRWFVRRSRHQGNKCLWSTTKITDVLPIYRKNVGTVCVFMVDKTEAEEAAREFVDDGLKAAPKLERFQYLRKTRFKPLERHVTRH